MERARKKRSRTTRASFCASVHRRLPSSCACTRGGCAKEGYQGSLASFCADWKSAKTAFQAARKELPSSGQQKLVEAMGNNLWQASFSGDSAKVATLLDSQDEQSFLNYQNENDVTALHMATVKNHLDVTRLLIEVDCNVNVTSLFGRTPLMTVTQRGYTSIATELITARCNVDLPEHGGATPLYMTAFFGNAKVAEQLIEARANIDLKHENGNTSLMISAWRGKVSVAKLVVAAREDIDVQKVDLDTVIITTVPMGALRGFRKGRRLGVWLEEDVHRETDNEEEEEEEDTSDVDSVEEDQDEEEEHPQQLV
jgi:ankyrin repeat protein